MCRYDLVGDVVSTCAFRCMKCSIALRKVETLIAIQKHVTDLVVGFYLLLAIGTPMLAFGEHQNTLFESIVVQKGKEPGSQVLLPRPVMPDGLSKEEQLARIENLEGRRVAVKELLRKATSAPLVQKVSRLDEAQGHRYRMMDTFFVVYTTLDMFEPSSTGGLSASGGDGKQITREELAARNIQSEVSHGSTGFVHTTSKMMDRVQLSTTTQYQLTRQPESVVVAMRLDPRFSKDEQYPNEWRKLTKKPGGFDVGDAEPYEWFSFYLKATKLADSDAVFVEYHLLMENPSGWFNGKDLIRSKIPLGTQNGIRKLRAEFKAKAAKPSKTTATTP